jgi:hypothetical protein
LIILNVSVQASHWYQITFAPLNIDTFLSGNGNFQEVADTIHSHLLILDISVNLVLSLALEDCDEKDKNAIVARIARITITTINSTKVKAELFLVLFINFKLILKYTDILIRI